MRYLPMLLLVCGCLGDNPDYRPGPSQDLLASVPDLAPPPADLGECAAGKRRCHLAESLWTSQLCHNGAWMDDRRCPQNSICTDGYCQKPPRQGLFEGKLCVRENDCYSNQPTTFSCQPFVTPGTLEIEQACAAQVSSVGTGGPGTTCKVRDGQVCRSGFCDENTHPATGGKNYCFRPCQIAPDCPSAANLCKDARITVEQIPFTQSKSCVPVN